METNKIIQGILLFTLLLLITGFLIYQHEVVHKTIWKYYGVDSEIKFYWNQAVTSPTSDYSGCDSNCELAHSINEIVGYTIMPLLIFILGMLLVIWYTILNKEQVVINLDKK